MGYASLTECVADLERHGMLVRMKGEHDARLEIPEIQRRLYQAGGPAILFERVNGSPFPMLGNLYGTMERTRFLFRDTLARVRKLVELKIDPGAFARKPWRYWDVPLAAKNLLPKRVRRCPVRFGETTISRLPQQVSWPMDGGGFVTLPQVYTEDADEPGWRKSNLGMYRVQLTGNSYRADREIGLHYQIHRGIGVHHAKAIRKGQSLKVSVWVGGPPAMSVAAVMPLPEGLPELAFAGVLGGRRVRLSPEPGGGMLAGDADFVITGTIDPDRQLPEGPFGDHLGYYSLRHDFPVMNVEKVYHRKDAIWLFTTVGRPPQEDTSFGDLIHELTGPVIPTVVHGVHAVNAVDAAGVHPLLLAIGSERYVPYAKERRPQELLTCASAILGQGQLSLAKYLLIVAEEDDPALDIHDIGRFLSHLLERVDWTRDLHFHTRTTIDTLDYSGLGFNEGSKLVIAAAGPVRRTLPTALAGDVALPVGFGPIQVCRPGILAIQAPPAEFAGAQPPSPGSLATGMPSAADRRLSPESGERLIERFTNSVGPNSPLRDWPLIVLVDDSAFCAARLNNFLWMVFTRSDPASDVHGIDPFVDRRHWGCRGPVVIDARIKPWMAPPLVEDPEITRKVDALAAPGGPLHGIL